MSLPKTHSSSLWVLSLTLLLAACQTATDPAQRSGAGAPEAVRIGDIEWLVDYDSALRLARETDRPLWVHFGENPG